VTAPLIAPDVAGKLLEEVIYERVLSFIDLDGLYEFEQQLWLAVGESGIAEDEVPARVKDMIDTALKKLIEEPRRYMTFGMGTGFDCELCEEEARMNVHKRTKHLARS
jgi:hypothetical protein